MRFFTSTFLLAVLAGTAFALPAHDAQKRSLITDLGTAIAGIEKGLGITDVEAQLDALLGGSLAKLEEALGITFAEKMLGLVEDGAPSGAVQVIGQGIAMVLEGVGVPEVNAFIDAATGGAVSSLEAALGVTDVEKALGLA